MPPMPPLPDCCAKPGPEAPRLVLQLRYEGKERIEELSGKAHYTIGRDAQDIILRGEITSRRHAALVHDVDGNTYICDLGSTHGVFLSSHSRGRLPTGKYYRVEPGVVITFGIREDNGVQGDRAVIRDAASLSTGSSRGPVAGAAVSSASGAQGRIASAGSSSSASAASAPRLLAPGGATAEPAAKRPRLQLATAATVAGVADAASAGAGRGAAASAGSGARLTGQHRAVHGPELPPGHHEQQMRRQAPEAKKGTKCDKCDGPHATEDCPHFKKAREDHKDAWANYGKKHPGHMGGSGGNFVLRGARVVRQPGDGSCLFHSLCFGLKAVGEHRNASQLRQELALFIKKNPKTQIAGDTLEEWVNWDANTSVPAYASRMAAGRAWGGGIEIAACALLKQTNIHVYERKSGEFKRISCFDCPRPTERVVHILYQGGVHYDALSVGR
eukprot:TRINITY_DN28899_c0_g1_i1.p1 TRINITY_DN28899_c0_g1~~TRINITY_DN28899_c0_g1_i1.p1  ORF type:complete len:444 (-),score=72.21 TRINITY_DN28899_c0_g1_i1:176-1507(-)